MITLPFQIKLQGRRLLIFLVASFLVFVSLTTVFAQTAPTGVTLLSNLSGATSSDSRIDTGNQAVSFRTLGAASLTSVKVDVSVRGGGSTNSVITVKIFGADNQNKPTGSALATKTIPSGTTEGAVTVTFDTAVSLSANTVYAISVGSGDRDDRVNQTGNSVRDQGSQWNFRNNHFHNGSAWTTSGGSLWKMQLIGTPTAGIAIKEPNSTPANNKEITAFVNITGTSNASGYSKYGLVSQDSECALSNNADSVFSSYTSGTTITLNSVSDNGKKACFLAYDGTNGVTALSAAIAGIRGTPSITITNPANTNPAQSKTISAVDNIVSTTAWHYVKVASSKTSCVAADFSGTPTAYTEGTSITLDVESYNDSKICFRSALTGTGTGYAISDIIDGIDATAPGVRSFISSNQLWTTDDDSGTTTMHYVKYSTSDDTKTCDSTAFTGSPTTYTEGTRLNLVEADNGQTYCFRSVDQVGNTGYRGSEINRIDTTAPSITITLELSNARIKAEDDEGGTSMYYLKKTDSSCTSSGLSGSPTTYTEGEWIPLAAADNSKKFCFISVDSGNNVGYALSGAISGIVDAPTVTVTNPANTDPAKTKTFSAVDDYHNTDNPTTWHRAFVASSEDCDDADFSGTPTAYTEGADVVLNDEANNSKRICFKSASGSDIGYGLSNVIGGIDATAPVVTVTGPANTNPAQSKVVSAADNDSGTTTWVYQKVASASSKTSCSASDFSGSESTYTEGTDITLSAEGDNGSKICFRSTDQAGNIGYGISVLIGGIDTTAPTITITNPNTNPAQSKVVSAADGDSTTTTWHSAKVSDANCDATDFTGSPTGYTEGGDITLSAEGDNGKRICFRSVDRAGNTAFAISNAIAGIDTTAPTVTVTGPANTNPAQGKSVKAADDDSTATTWVYQRVASASSKTSCSASDFSSPETYIENSFVDSDSESENGSKLCFRSTDGAGNIGYGISALIAGIDTTAPTITITNPNTNPATSKIVTAAD
ncbi:MAG: hypothetical protein OYG31_03320, partial [Candidatus Kaiserbacteria bacterium]|nr:hypothetical protein [Candidatus Kaiserbacteria bacterium]